MRQAIPEVIRVGVAGARIQGVSRQRIEYVDTEGQEHFVDLEDCARNWLHWHEDHSQEFSSLPGATQEDFDTENARYVGRRGGAKGSCRNSPRADRKRL